MTTEESPSSCDTASPDPKPPKGPPHYTAMREHFQPPVWVSSLSNTTTRHGYTDRSIASGVVPTADGDMYRNPEYHTPRYTSEFMDPNKR